MAKLCQGPGARIGARVRRSPPPQLTPTPTPTLPTTTDGRSVRSEGVRICVHTHSVSNTGRSTPPTRENEPVHSSPACSFLAFPYPGTLHARTFPFRDPFQSFPNCPALSLRVLELGGLSLVLFPLVFWLIPHPHQQTTCPPSRLDFLWVA